MAARTQARRGDRGPILCIGPRSGLCRQTPVQAERMLRPVWRREVPGSDGATETQRTSAWERRARCGRDRRAPRSWVQTPLCTGLEGELVNREPGAGNGEVGLVRRSQVLRELPHPSHHRRSMTTTVVPYRCPSSFLLPARNQAPFIVPVPACPRTRSAPFVLPGSRFPAHQFSSATHHNGYLRSQEFPTPPFPILMLRGRS